MPGRGWAKVVPLVRSNPCSLNPELAGNQGKRCSRRDILSSRSLIELYLIKYFFRSLWLAQGRAVPTEDGRKRTKGEFKRIHPVQLAGNCGAALISQVDDLCYRLDFGMNISLDGAERLMAQELLNQDQVSGPVQHVGRKRMASAVEHKIVRQASRFAGSGEVLGYREVADMRSLFPARGKNPFAGGVRNPGAEDGAQSAAERYIPARLLRFAIGIENQVLLPEDIVPA